MNGRSHLYAGIAALIVLYAVRLDRLPFLIVAVLFGAMMPDLDIYLLGLGRHRNPLFHSSAIPAALFAYCCFTDTVFFAAAFATGVFSHLLLDIRVTADAATAVRTRRTWIALNAAICIVFMIWW